jgi:hypothetical protein
MLFVLLSGCGDLLLLRDAVEDLTNPLVVQAFYIGVEPLPPGLDLGGSEWANGSTARVLLADASALSDLSSAPIDDAAVTLENQDGSFELAPEGEGSWSASGADGLAWHSQATVVVGIQRDESSQIALTTPAAPELELAAVYAASEDLALNLEGQPFDNLLVTVIRLADGETVYDSTPVDITDLYRLTHGSTELSVVVPGSALAEPGLYAIGVAGLVNADPDDYEGVNLALSALTAGALVFTQVEVRG